MSDSDPIIFTSQPWRGFLSLDTIPREAGVRHDNLAALALKELVDNALDAGINVKWGYLWGDEDDGPVQTGFYVQDDGDGLPGTTPEEWADFFSVSRPFTTSKMIRLPTRGALGNGLRVVSGIAFASDGGIVVTTQGHRIAIGLNETTGRAYPAAVETGETTGTRIEVTLGRLNRYNLAGAGQWADVALWLSRRGGKAYKGKTSAHWYPHEVFFELCAATPPGVTVRQLVTQFDGCTGKKAGEIAGPFGGRTDARTLTRDQAHDLLKRMQSVSDPVKPERLGAIGPDAYDCWDGHESYKYAKIAGKTLGDNIPYVIEAWAVPDDDGRVQVTVNATPITGDISATYGGDKRQNLYVMGCGLSDPGYQMRIVRLSRRVNVYVNVITPHMPITSNGKAPDLSGMRTDIHETIATAAKRAARGGPRDDRPEKPRDQKDIIYTAIPDAAQSAGGGLGFSLRQLFYVIRPIVKDEIGKDLDYGYFAGLVTDYENEHGDIPGMYRKPRGTVYHPYDHQKIPLGTKEAAIYKRPDWTFNKCLFIEKEGFCDLLIELGWPEKNDCALISSEGHATGAVKDVVDRLAESDEPIMVFCLHDADAAGTMIYQALQEATRARGRRKVEIVNLGLEPWEAQGSGLQVEDIKKLDNLRPVADYVRDYGREANPEIGKLWIRWLQAHRVELNAMNSREFVAWLDEKIADYPGKVIPPVDVIAARLEDERDAAIAAAVDERIKVEMADRIEDLTNDARKAVADPLADLAADFKGTISHHFERRPADSWRTVIDGAVADAVDAWTTPNNDPDPGTGGGSVKIGNLVQVSGRVDRAPGPAKFSTTGGSS